MVKNMMTDSRLVCVWIGEVYQRCRETKKGVNIIIKKSNVQNSQRINKGIYC